MSYLNGLREHLIRSVLQDMPEGAEIDVSLLPTTACCVIDYPDGGCARIPMEAGGHAFALGSGMCTSMFLDTIFNEASVHATGTLTLPPKLPLSMAASEADQSRPSPASTSYFDASVKPKPACIQCHEARKKCEGGIPCNLCSRKGSVCAMRIKPNSSGSTPASSGSSSNPRYSAGQVSDARPLR
ncbi:hypothetical protein K466DRAFT_604330 [Polyporus arcularius HHB13444]|uniref:Zn(2)-C6 fungal-type domain-containing protein n=1 Tax=Polyporus arcularius HHB13444 TaxID=1314778 RepID=A0A5C3NW99_9APHY|nr:hypothetical protein K466DRAFT_604330 [Polyporus arcularius HHB13444]